MSYTFVRHNNGSTVTHSFGQDEMTWPELAEEFFVFLRGCGYELDRKDFADYWSQYQEDAYDDWDDDWNGVYESVPPHDDYDYNVGDVYIGDIAASISPGEQAFSNMADTLINTGTITISVEDDK
jgi:hypothetical protein